MKKKIFLEFFLFGLIELYILGLSVNLNHSYRSKAVHFAIAINVITFLVMIGVALVGVMLYKKMQLYKITFVCGVIFAIVYSILLPPGSVPDEGHHMNAAYAVSNVLVGKDYSTSIRECDYDFLYKEEQPGYYSVEANDNFFKGIFSRPQNTKCIKTETVSTNTFPIEYVLSGAGIALGRVLGLSAKMAFMLGRLFNSIFYWLVIAIAIKYIPFYKMGIFGVAFLPMSLQQGMSFSYDAIIIPAAIIIFSLTTCLYHEDNAPNRLWIYLLIATSFLFVEKNFAYFLVALYPFIMLFMKYLKNIDKQARKKYIVLLVVVLIYSFIAYKMTHAPSSSLVEYRDGFYNVDYAKSHIYSVFRLFYLTLIYNSGFYLESFVGIDLAWFKIHIPDVFYTVLVVLLCLSLIKRKNENYVPAVKVKLLNNFIFWGTVGIVVLGMLLSWTKVGDTSIQGIQGRYFIPAFAFLGSSVYSEKLEIDESIDKWIIASFVVVEAIIVMHLLRRF